MSGNYHSRFKRYKRNLRWKAGQRKHGSFTPCLKCGHGEMITYPGNFAECNKCGVKTPVYEGNRWLQPQETPDVAPASHPDPWMDNEPGATTFPENWQ